MLDIIKYLKKMDITIKKIDEKNLIFIDNSKEKKIQIKELEQYLFICLTDYIKEI